MDDASRPTRAIDGLVFATSSPRQLEPVGNSDRLPTAPGTSRAALPRSTKPLNLCVSRLPQARPATAWASLALLTVLLGPALRPLHAQPESSLAAVSLALPAATESLPVFRRPGPQPLPEFISGAAGSVNHVRTFSYCDPALAICHQPPYFEQVATERFGLTSGVWDVPISAGHFAKDLAFLPMQTGLVRPHEMISSTGAGPCGARCECGDFTLRRKLTAGVVQGCAIWGLVGLVP